LINGPIFWHAELAWQAKQLSQLFLTHAFGDHPCVHRDLSTSEFGSRRLQAKKRPVSLMNLRHPGCFGFEPKYFL